MVLPAIHVYTVYTITVLSFIINTVLIFFICKHSVSELGRYRYLMLIFSTFNIAYSIVQAVVMPVIHVYDLSFFVIATGIRPMPYDVERFAAAVFCSTFAQSLYFVSLHFLYRYIQVVRPQARFLFEDPLYITSLITLYIFVAIDYGSVCFFNFKPTSVKDKYFQEQMRISYDLNITEVGYLGPIYFLDGRLQWIDMTGLLNVAVVIGATFALIPFCGIKIARCLQKQDIPSKKTKELQVQMFRVLLIQSFFPLALTFVPSSAILIMSLFGRKIGAHGNIVAVLLTLYPVIDPLVVLYFVKSYRKAIRMYFRLLRNASVDRSSAENF